MGFSSGMSTSHCLGPCAQYPDCNGTCKKLSYQIGQCVHAFPNNDFCCCAKRLVKPTIDQFN